MSNYGRNFEFRIAPERGQRNGRYVNATGGELVLGTPIGGTPASPASRAGIRS
jgi:hypothetical protein